MAAPQPTTKAAERPVLLRTENIIKRFPGVVALKGVSFDLRQGEIHSLCGENGAGKSTLIKTLSGIHPFGSYEGQMLLDGKPLELRSTGDAEANKIAVIYQELALVPEMTVAENIFLGREPKRGAFIDWITMSEKSRELLQRFGINIDPDTKVRDLGVGLQQLVEIVKALAKDSRILILDEPTAALSESEVEILLDILRDLRERGVTCVYISHKLGEVFAISDRITVLRDGATIVTLDADKTDRAEVIRNMVGREIGDLFPRHESKPGKTLLDVKGVSVAPPEGSNTQLRDISFEVRAGEVLGIGGLMGAGRSELLMHIFGAWGTRTKGNITLDGASLDGTSPSRSIASGLVMVTEDRKRYGLVLDENIGFNMSLSSLGGMTAAGILDAGREWKENRFFFDSLRVKAPGLESVVGKLSGGNQQKVVLGKALMTKPKVVFLDEPTRGIDVGAKLEVYNLINELTDSGQAVVLVSSELPELMGMSDRIIMLNEGQIGGVFTRQEATPEKLLAAAMGQTASTDQTILV
ncbi:sugar ABC transporter ATP-binding protein [bacterium]|nr:MAG: sugar ABC transporter ATP-binding protein [bacterium]